MSPTMTARCVELALGREQVVDPAQRGPGAGVQVPPLPGQHVLGGVGLRGEHLGQLTALGRREVAYVGHRRLRSMLAAMDGR